MEARQFHIHVFCEAELIIGNEPWPLARPNLQLAFSGLPLSREGSQLGTVSGLGVHPPIPLERMRPLGRLTASFLACLTGVCVVDVPGGRQCAGTPVSWAALLQSMAHVCV